MTGIETIDAYLMRHADLGGITTKEIKNFSAWTLRGIERISE